MHILLHRVSRYFWHASGAVAIALAVGSLLLPCSVAHAQNYPAKPVKMVVPFPPGGSLDIAGRLIAQRLTDAWGQAVVVENKPGAGGNIGADFVAKSPPDGYTILLGALSTHAVNPSLYAKMPYDAAKDFAPITLIAITPNVLVVNAASPVNSVKEFIAYAKANPGKLKALAVTTAERSKLVPELPTMAEAGLPGFDISTWYGFFAPAGTPPAIVAKWNAEVTKILNAPDVRAKLMADGAEPAPNTPEQFAQMIARELAKYARIVKMSGAKVD